MRTALMGIVALLLGIGVVWAAPDDIGEARLWLQVMLTGVHNLDAKWEARRDDNTTETDTHTVRDRMTLVYEGGATWPVRQDWTNGNVVTFSRVWVSGSGWWREVRNHTEVCPQHGDALRPYVDRQSARWTYSPPKVYANDAMGEFGSPVGQIVISPLAAEAGEGEVPQAVPEHGSWLVNLAAMCDFDAMGPRGSYRHTNDFCHNHTKESSTLANATIPDAHDIAVVDLVREAYQETIGGSLGGDGKHATFQGNWEKKKNGFFVAAQVIDKGGVEQQPVAQDWPEGVPEGATVTGTRDRYWTAVINYSATFTTKPQDIECVVKASGPTDGKTVGYAQWLPEGGPNETTGGNTLDIEARIHPKGRPNETPKRRARFRFELVRTSTEPGVALNWPQSHGAMNPDLLFVDHGLTTVRENGTVAETQAGDLQAATARLQCRDFGAYGAVRVTAFLDDAEQADQRTPVTGHLEGNPRQETITVPRDDNGNWIADSWEVKLPTQDPRWDEESEPGPGAKPGDGLTQYEEYRGLAHDGKPLRLDPRRKDLVVLNEAGDVARPGLDLFEQATGIRVRELPKLEMDWMIVNQNSLTTRVSEQYAVRLVREPLAGTTLGAALPEGPMASPGDAGKLVINTDLSFVKEEERPARVAAEVAHLIGHALGLRDHGEPSKPLSDEEKNVKANPPTIHWFPEQLIALRPFLLSGYVETAPQGGPASGPQDCFMRVSERTMWVRRKDAAGVTHYYMVPPTPPGTRFCEAPVGTGINAPDNQPFSYFGNCAKGRGACLKRLRVKEW